MFVIIQHTSFVLSYTAQRTYHMLVNINNIISLMTFQKHCELFS